MEQSNTTYRPERRDAAENRKRILDVASKLFEIHGVEEVSMNQIATEAQIGAGTLYRRYRNKSELCSELIQDNANLLFEEIATYLQNHQSYTAGERLRGLMSLFIQFREKNVQLLTGIENSNDRGIEEQNKSPLYHRLHHILCTLFEEVSPENEPSFALFQADMLMSALRNDSYVFQKKVRGNSSDYILEHICKIFIP